MSFQMSQYFNKEFIVGSIKQWWNDMEEDEQFKPKPKQRIAVIIATNLAALGFVYALTKDSKYEKYLPNEKSI